jgi:hypothetical protein
LFGSRAGYREFPEGVFAQAVRMGDYKAIRKKKGAIERYDLNSNLGEQHDIAEQHPEAVTRAAAIFGSARTQKPNWRVAAKAQAAPRR